MNPIDWLIWWDGFKWGVGFSVVSFTAICTVAWGVIWWKTKNFCVDDGVK